MKNEKYSGKDFTGQSFASLDADEFNNSEIIGSCFAQEAPYSSQGLDVNPPDPMINVFPPSITGVTFTRCNLDNCNIPVGNTVSGGINRKIRVQNDLSDWILDGDNKPIEPQDKKDRIKLSISIEPNDIPLVKQEKDILRKT